MMLRGIVFLSATAAYLFWRTGNNHPPLSVSVLVIAWLLLMTEMILRFFPSRTESMGCQRQFAKNYYPTGLPPLKPKNQNRAVLGVVLAWVILNGGIGALYFTHIIDSGILMLISLAYSVCDMICILLFCPFQVLFLKNKCCTTCRIYNWDFAMMFTPLIFIPHLYTWSLLAVALALLLRWEIAYQRHPERFYETSNNNLHCANCKEQLCNQKKHIRRLRKKLMAELKDELAELKENLGELKDDLKEDLNELKDNIKKKTNFKR